MCKVPIHTVPPVIYCHCSMFCRLLTSTSAALLDENAPVLTSQQLDDVKVCSELLQCIPVTNKLGADDICALISLSLVFIKLLHHQQEHSVRKGVVSEELYCVIPHLKAFDELCSNMCRLV